jgi:hypothetical protein
MKAGTKSRAPMTAAAVATPLYSITFGHNVPERGVLFGIADKRLVFTPEDAEDIAAKLLEEARKARGGT